MEHEKRKGGREERERESEEARAKRVKIRKEGCVRVASE
jgi:hypothetical protein